MGGTTEGIVFHPDRLAFGDMHTAVGAGHDALGRSDARRGPLRVGVALPDATPDLRNYESQQ